MAGLTVDSGDPRSTCRLSTDGRYDSPSLRVIEPPVWDPSARRRARWRAIANDEANAAERADELYVARAFRAIVKLLDADALPLEDVPRTHHGRKLVRAEALRLARTGLNGAEIARVLDEPRFTIARWLRVAGMNRRPDDYERAAFAQRASRRYWDRS